jgi:ribose transport system permease protein
MMMISMGTGSIVSNVQSATFPTRSAEGGWFKSIFKYIGEEGATIPTGAFVLLAIVVISHIILSKTKMGRYTYAIGSNKEAARLSGVNTDRWEMMTYTIAGTYAGVGGIAYAATYTTILPSQGQGFELFAIAGAVIGGTSLAGGVGTVWGTLIGVFIMSVLSNGLPAMDLQSHYQTFFTGVVVIGAVMLDQYRSRKASEVKVETEADRYRRSMREKIAELKKQRNEHKQNGETEKVAEVDEQIKSTRQEMNETYKRMKAEEKAEQERIRNEEKEAEREFEELLKQREAQQDAGASESSGASQQKPGGDSSR